MSINDIIPWFAIVWEHVFISSTALEFLKPGITVFHWCIFWKSQKIPSLLVVQFCNNIPLFTMALANIFFINNTLWGLCKMENTLASVFNENYTKYKGCTHTGIISRECWVEAMTIFHVTPTFGIVSGKVIFVSIAQLLSFVKWGTHTFQCFTLWISDQINRIQPVVFVITGSWKEANSVQYVIPLFASDWKSHFSQAVLLLNMGIRNNLVFCKNHTKMQRLLPVWCYNKWMKNGGHDHVRCNSLVCYDI